MLPHPPYPVACGDALAALLWVVHLEKNRGAVRCVSPPFLLRTRGLSSAACCAKNQSPVKYSVHIKRYQTITCLEAERKQQEMAATPSTATVSRSTEVSFFAYLREVVSGTAASLLQEVPLGVASEAACLLQEVPAVELACKTFLLLEQLVETAKVNKSDLITLRDLCDVVINAALETRSSGRSGLLEDVLTELQQPVGKAQQVAKLCNAGRVKRLVLARKICNDIAAVRKDVLSFCAARDYVLADDVQVSASSCLGRQLRAWCYC